MNNLFEKYFRYALLDMVIISKVTIRKCYFRNENYKIKKF